MLDSRRQRRPRSASAVVAAVLVLASLLGGGASPAVAAPPTSGAYYGRVMIGERPATAGEVAVRWGRAASSVDDFAVTFTDQDGYFQVPTSSGGYHQVFFDYRGDPALGILDRWYGSGYLTSRAGAPSVYSGVSLGTTTLLPPFDVAGSVSLGVAGSAPPPDDVIVDVSAVPTGSPSGPWSDPVDVAADGTFHLTGIPPGAVAVRVRYVGANHFDSETISVLPGTLTATPPATVAVTVAPQWRLRGVVLLGRSGVVAQSTEADVAPAAGGPWQPVSSTGRYDLWVDPPTSGTTLPIHVRYSGTGDYLPSASWVQSNGSNAILRIADAFVMRGTVGWGEAGVAPPSSSIRVQADARAADASGYSTTTVTVAPDGSWVMPRLPRGTYTLTFSHTRLYSAPPLYVGSGGLPGQATTPSEGFELAQNRSDLDVVVSLGAEIRGVVTDSEGDGVAGASVTIETTTSSGTSLTSRTVTAASDGSWRAVGLDTGRWYRLRIAGPTDEWGSGYWVAASAPLASSAGLGTILSVPSISTVHVADASLLRLGSISGRVGVARDAASRSVHLNLLASDGSWRYAGSTRLDSAGWYSFRGLVPGTYRVDVKGFSDVSSPPLTVEEGGRLIWNTALSVAMSRNTGGSAANDVLARDGQGRWWRSSIDATGRLGTRTPVSLTVPARSVPVVIGDANGDGFTDLVVRASDGSLTLAASTGADAFAAPVAIPHVGRALQVAPLGDRNGDGIPELFVVSTNGYAQIRLSNGPASWNTPMNVGPGWNVFRSVSGVGDFDGDARADLLARTATGVTVLCRAVDSLPPTFECDRLLSSAWGRSDSVVGSGDLNGDGFADVLVGRADGRVLLYRGTGTGGFRLGAVQVGSRWTGLALVA